MSLGCLGYSDVQGAARCLLWCACMRGWGLRGCKLALLLHLPASAKASLTGVRTPPRASQGPSGLMRTRTHREGIACLSYWRRADHDLQQK